MDFNLKEIYICLLIMSIQCFADQINSVCLHQTASTGNMIAENILGIIKPNLNLVSLNSSSLNNSIFVIPQRIQKDAVKCLEVSANKSKFKQNQIYKTVLRIGEKFNTNKWKGNVSTSSTKDSANVEKGRLFFFKGVKKLIWTLFLGLQIVKSLLLALFLPSILGSIGKIVGKGITAISGLNQPTEIINGLDFKDAAYYINKDNKLHYNAIPNSGEPFSSEDKKYDDSGFNKPLSRLGIIDQNDMLNSYTSTKEVSDIASKNNFNFFLNIPTSSLLLTNYDPFYSPLLSRLEAVFQQLGLEGNNESCRKKIICFMYSNPAKYAPYSNLISAQLSRDVNELRKPNAGSPEISRFFGYMKAAKDGQDGEDCGLIYKECSDLKDAEDPIMITTYHEINKLVHARKIL